MQARHVTTSGAQPPPIAASSSDVASTMKFATDEDDEKYDKIKAKQDKFRKFLFMILGAMIIVIIVVEQHAMDHSKKTVSIIRSANSKMSPGGAGDTSLQQQQQQGDEEQPAEEEEEGQEQREDAEETAEEKGDDGEGEEEIEESEEELETRRKELDAEVRKIKKTGVIMETDPESLRVTKQLQDVTRKLIKVRYGDHPAYRVKVYLQFQPSIPDYAKKGKDGSFVIEMAPIDLIPVSVFTFLEEARTWKRGAFHRNAQHVLQVTAESGVKDSLPFQEYSPQFPHKKGTTGYCGRPSGPCWYISIQDNSENHGPGSQQQENPYEADANFGKIVEGMDDVVPRIHSTPQKSWLDKAHQIFITKMTILVPTGKDGAFEPWEPKAEEEEEEAE